MYQVHTSILTTGTVAGGGTLAVTGLNSLHHLVAAVTLIFFGLAMLRLAPRREA